MLHIIWDFVTIGFVFFMLIGLVIGVWVGFYSPKPRSLKGKHVMVSISHFKVLCPITLIHSDVRLPVGLAESESI